MTSTEISTSTNRFTSGVSYDGAGNVTSDTKFRGRQYQYDANNRQRWSALSDGTNIATAIYDGIGQRVQTTAAGVTRTLVYDTNGQMIAEYEGGVWKRDYISGGGLSATVDSSGAVRYVMNDHQGSTRVVTDQSGAITARHDYLPFGEEISSGTGQRTSSSSGS